MDSGNNKSYYINTDRDNGNIGQMQEKRDLKNINDGAYYFDGYIPGDYIVRFIYGDSNETITTDYGNSEENHHRCI